MRERHASGVYRVASHASTSSGAGSQASAEPIRIQLFLSDGTPVEERPLQPLPDVEEER